MIQNTLASKLDAALVPIFDINKLKNEQFLQEKCRSQYDINIM